MNKIKPDVDVVLDILKDTLAAYPTSGFIASLLFQYQERGGLSKKQLEGLQHKAINVINIPPGKLATLQAIILKKPTRYKSEAPLPIVQETKDTVLEGLLDDILQKFPDHKRVRFIKMKFDSSEPISLPEKAEITRFHKLLIKP